MKFTALLIVSMLCASVSAGELFYEDFEDPGNVQVTLSPTFIVADGYLKAPFEFSASTSVLDGTYSPSDQHPIQIEATFNHLNCVEPWETIKIAIGHDGNSGTTDGLVVQWSPLITPTYAGAYMQVQGMVNNQWQGSECYYCYPDGTGVGPANFDENTDYVLTVIDYGDTLDVSVHEAADPSNIGIVTGIDISGYTRKGDYIATNVARAWMSECGIGIDDIRVLSLPLCLVTVEHTDGKTEVAENGETTDSFTVVLDDEPSATVVLTLDPPTDDVKLNGAAPNAPITLTFETGNWDTPQTVTVMANDDTEAEGKESIRVDIDMASTDLDFVCSTTTAVSVMDDDREDVQITGAPEVAEEGMTTDTYEVVLAFPPNGDVTITIDDTSEPNQILVNGGETATLTFTAGNWDTPQTVTVKAIDDPDPEEHPHSTTLTHTAGQTGGNQNYNGIPVDNVAVEISENDCGFGPFDDTDHTGGPGGQPDCITNLLDFAHFVADYLKCSIGFCS